MLTRPGCHLCADARLVVAAVCAEYLEDAQEAADQELVSFFEAVLQEDRKRAERAKDLLAKRLASTQRPAA